MDSFKSWNDKTETAVQQVYKHVVVVLKDFVV